MRTFLFLFIWLDSVKIIEVDKILDDAKYEWGNEINRLRKRTRFPLRVGMDLGK